MDMASLGVLMGLGLRDRRLCKRKACMSRSTVIPYWTLSGGSLLGREVLESRPNLWDEEGKLKTLPNSGIVLQRFGKISMIWLSNNKSSSTQRTKGSVLIVKPGADV